MVFRASAVHKERRVKLSQVLAENLLVLGRKIGQKTDKSLVEILTDAGKVVVGPRQGERTDKSLVEILTDVGKVVVGPRQRGQEDRP